MAIIDVDASSGLPLIGHIAFGVVLRGESSLIQVRTTTICNMNCTFCSTDAGPFSTHHKTHFVVDPDYMLQWIKEVVREKGETHVNIDSVGEPTAYPHLAYLIGEIKKIEGVYFISMQTNGTLLTEKLIKELEKAGLSRIHLSVHSLNKEVSKALFGNEHYNIEKIKETIERVRKTPIELALTPVWMPGINDKDIEEIIAFGKEHGCKVAIQKYESYKHSRKVKEAKKASFFQFYKKLKEWEKKYGVKLKFGRDDFNIQRGKSIPPIMKRGERIQGIIKTPDWYDNQMIAVAKNRCITVLNCKQNVGDKVNLKIIENANNLYLAEKA